MLPVQERPPVSHARCYRTQSIVDGEGEVLLLVNGEFGVKVPCETLFFGCRPLFCVKSMRLGYSVGIGPGMAAVLFRCPNTKLRVQGWLVDNPTKADGETYEPIVCTACTRAHLVNQKTGKVLGADEDRSC
jgi:hypothetical protein